MCFAIRLTAIFLVYAVLMVFSRPAFSQEQNSDLQRGIAEFRQENYEEALDGLLKARSAEPDLSLAAYYLGITYKNLQNYEEAKKHLKTAINLLPEIKEAILELADVHYQLGELKESMDTLMIAEKKNVRPGQTAFLKGLVLLEMNENAAAVESFKKARELSPGLVQAADYQIALALLKEGELEEAEGRFNDVIVKDPNTDMAAFAGDFIEKINKKKREKRPFRFYLGLHFQYDDNVVLKPSDAVAAEDITDEDDYREVLTLGLEYMPKPRRPFDISVHYSLYLSNHHDLGSHDVQSHTFVLVPSYKINQNSSADLALSYNYTLVDDDEYLSTAAVSPTYTRSFGRDHTLQVYVSYQKKEFLREPSTDDEDRDADQYSVNFNWFYFFTQDRGILVPFMEKFKLSYFAQNKGYLNLFYKLYKEETDGKNWEFIGSKANATFLIPFTEKSKLSLSGGIEYEDFENTHTVFDKERRDIIYSVSALFFYRFYKDADIQLLYIHRRDDSNIALYDYHRNVYSVGVEWRY